jgi:hypothetical protein
MKLMGALDTVGIALLATGAASGEPEAQRAGAAL